jgi:hypothetical protein
MEFELYSMSFCGACRRTRAVLDRAAQLVPGTTVREYDVAFAPDRAAAEEIRSTPTVLLRSSAGIELMRAEGVPTLDHVLVAAARALEA